MKKNVVLFFVLLVGIVTCGAQKITPVSDIVTENRTIMNFKQISVSNGIEVVVTFGGTDRLEIDAPKNLIQYVEVVTDKDVLYIRLKKGVKVKGTTSVKVFVDMTTLTKIVAKDNSNVTFDGTLTVEKFDVDLEKGSSIKGNIFTQKSTISLSNSSRANLSGSCKDLKLTASDKSIAEGLSFTVENLILKLTGESTTRFTVTQSVDYTGKKKSNFYYGGSPNLKNINTSDSGLYKSE